VTRIASEIAFDTSDDLALPFVVATAGVRGRLVRLSDSVDEIVKRHRYPQPVAQLLAELLVLGSSLGSLLKYKGIFTLQTRSEGPIRFMVVDVTTEGAIRGYVESDLAAVDEVLRQDPEPSVPRLCGSGYMALTVDQNEAGERYQGIVELTGSRLTDCFGHYFRQSEQLPSAFHLAVHYDPVAERWSCAALTLQRLPANEHAPETPALTEAREEGWRRATMLMSTLRDEELLDPALEPERLVHRLFHEEEYEVHERWPLRAQCRCSAERVERVLINLSDGELDEMTTEEGRIEVTCQFCNRVYRYGRDAVPRPE